jgi:hypothetical protein
MRHIHTHVANIFLKTKKMVEIRCHRAHHQAAATELTTRPPLSGLTTRPGCRRRPHHQAKPPPTGVGEGEEEAHHAPVLTVDYRIKVHMDLQADKSPVVVKGPFFPRVVNPRY